MRSMGTISIIDEIDVCMTDYARCETSDYLAMLRSDRVFTRSGVYT